MVNMHMKVTAVIEKSDDRFFSIYTEEDIPYFSFGGYGESPTAAMDDYMTCIQEMREIARETGKEFPEAIEVEFRYDTATFIRHAEK